MNLLVTRGLTGAGTPNLLSTRGLIVPIPVAPARLRIRGGRRPAEQKAKYKKDAIREIIVFVILKHINLEDVETQIKGQMRRVIVPSHISVSVSHKTTITQKNSERILITLERLKRHGRSGSD